MKRSVALILLLLCTYIVKAQEIVGIPTTGAMGIKVPVSELMRQAEIYDRSPHPIVIREEFESRRHPKSSPNALKVSQWPPSSDPVDNTHVNRGEQVQALQTIHSNFLGITLSEGNSVPPDSNGDVSSTQVCVVSNGRIKFYNRNTVCAAAQTTVTGTNTTPLASPAFNSSLDAFFVSVRNGSGISDPHVRYDRATNKWFIVAINVAAASNRCVIAVSSGPTISALADFTFYFFVFDALGSPPGGGYTGGFFDYPTLGVDANALYIGSRMFSTTSSYIGASLFVVRKSSITSGGPIVTTAFHLAGTSTTGVYTPQGADNDDPTATQGYFIGVDQALFNTLDIIRISTPGATPTASATIQLTVPATSLPLNQVSSGTVQTMDANDDRNFAAMIRKNKITGTTSLWTAHANAVTSAGVSATSGAGRRNGVRWYEINNLAAAPALVQSGTVFDNAVSNPRGYWFPSIATSGQGHSVMGFSTAAANQFADCAVSGRYRTDALGSNQGVTLATASATSYNPAFDNSGTNNRWGDYSQTIVDPLDDMTMWTFQEYCDNTDNWGMRAIQLKAPPPAAPTSPGTIGCGTPSGGNRVTSVTLNGTSSNNSEFFDPGAGYTNRLAVSSTGAGVSISNLTFVNITQLTFDVTWPTGLAGTSQTLTITNPDCQSVTTTYTIPSGCSVVPVYYISFTGRDIGRRVLLNWVTASEPGNAYFEIERKNANGDWVVIGTMNSKGINGGNYSFIDENPLAVNFYRLKQYDIDRKFTYSTIVLVEMKSPDAFTVYPNPVKEQLNVEFPDNYRNGKLRMISASGATVFSSRINSINKQVVDVSLLAAGTYIVEIESVQGQRLQKTVIVQKREPRP